MSFEVGSTPKRLASFTFTFSSISSLMTSCRFCCLRVVMKLSLLRCSMSMLVIGSPLTMTAMVWARAGAPQPIAASRIAAKRVERRNEGMAVMFLSAFSTCSIRAALGGQRFPGVRLLKAARAGCARRIRDGSQTDLQHERMVQGWRRDTGGVVVRRHVVGGQHEAIVHIAGADDVLVDLVGFKVPARRTRDHPVGCNLHRGG